MNAISGQAPNPAVRPRSAVGSRQSPTTETAATPQTTRDSVRLSAEATATPSSSDRSSHVSAMSANLRDKPPIPYDKVKPDWSTDTSEHDRIFKKCHKLQKPGQDSRNQIRRCLEKNGYGSVE